MALVDQPSIEFVLLILYGTLQVLIGLVSVFQQWRMSRRSSKPLSLRGHWQSLICKRRQSPQLNHSEL